MSCSNNVRKVMNVEISSRFNGNSAIMFINNDLVLEWWKDDVKKKRLFCSDGYNLTAYGFSVMLDHWMVSCNYLLRRCDLNFLRRISICNKFTFTISIPFFRSNWKKSWTIRKSLPLHIHIVMSQKVILLYPLITPSHV